MTTQIGPLLAGVAAVTTAVVGLLTYLDRSETFENPVGESVTEVISGNGDNGDRTTTNDTSTTPPPTGVVIQSLTVDGSGCFLTVSWDATGEGSLELIRNGESVEELPVEPGTREESMLDVFGEGSYEVTYELVAYDSEHQETDRSSESTSVVCIG